jgi:UPF0755 protein
MPTKSRTTWGVRAAIFFVVLLLLGIGSWVWWNDSIAPVDSQNTTPEIFAINTGESVRSVSARLTKENFIRSSTAFFILVKMMGIDNALQAGDFRLNRSMNARKIAEELTHGIVDVWVTTLEGWRVDEIATKLTKDLDIPEGEFLKVAQEGYMFPDTYLIPKNATAGAIVRLFKDNFDTKVTEKMREDARNAGLSLEKVVTLASIVEREGRTEEDRPVIAGILLKRLEADWPLQTDATLQYINGYQSADKSWWKKNVTNADKELDSPYNTYKNTGLPPGPIANPGLSSIKAVIYPQKSEYWYYLHDPAGGVHYAVTYEEHLANIAKYLQ